MAPAQSARRAAKGADPRTRTNNAGRPETAPIQAAILPQKGGGRRFVFVGKVYSQLGVRG